MQSALLRRYAKQRLSSEHASWAEGSSVTSRWFDEAVLRVIVIVSPSWGPALCHHGRSGYQPFSLIPNPDELLAPLEAMESHPGRSAQVRSPERHQAQGLEQSERLGQDGAPENRTCGRSFCAALNALKSAPSFLRSDRARAPRSWGLRAALTQTARYFMLAV